MGKVNPQRIQNMVDFLQQDMVDLLINTARVENNNIYIREVLDRTNAIDEKYNHHPFVQAMIIAYCDYIDKAVRKLDKK